MRSEQEIRAVMQDYTYTHKGVTYQIALARMEADKPWMDDPIAALLFLNATPVDGGKPIPMELYMSAENIADTAYMLAEIDETIRQIVDGELRPGERRQL